MKRTLAVLASFAFALVVLCRIASAAPPATATAAPSVQAVGDPIAKAKELFQRYVELEHSFDPAQADLYSDKAMITNKRIMPDGKVVPLTVPALRYKKVIRDGMAEARRKGDIANYTGDTYTLEKGKVRINVVRYLALKKYSSPMSMVVGPDAASGKWLILEENSESHM
ncbi:MAG TPA: hypothetical protein VIE43_01760 [Thermoanaerobaculia bacterium]|jgi:hypothetical protein|nr:hypothetical protein [Thermoanaerobaculia bacterium]